MWQGLSNQTNSAFEISAILGTKEECMLSCGPPFEMGNGVCPVGKKVMKLNLSVIISIAICT